MPDAIKAFTLGIPAGNGSQKLWFIDCPLGLSDVTQIDLVFPPGCSGLVGVRVEFSVNPVYPIGNSGWFVLDDERLQIPVSKQGNSGQWRLTGYNEDSYTHSINAYFYYNYVDLTTPGSSQLVSL